MGDALELVADRLVDQRVAVAVDVAPQRGDAVDVAPPVGVDQVGALAALDHQRLLLGPVALLRERVPDVALIEVGDFVRHRCGDDRRRCGGTGASTDRGMCGAFGGILAPMHG